jgi:glucosamine 6-phosphate synthetase-like amidotransferase/phosphosugar isomerase protein
MNEFTVRVDIVKAAIRRIKPVAKVPPTVIALVIGVLVITTWPEYNLDASEEAKVFTEYTEEDGIAVIRVKTLPHHNVNYLIEIPTVEELFSPLLVVIPLQLLAYRIARLRGLNVDQPRNLAKTDTVE